MTEAARFLQGRSVLVPTRLFQFLGARPDRPFVPTAAQAAALQAVRLPWPGLDPQGVPYPTVFALNFGRRAGKTTLLEILLWIGALAPDDAFGPPVVRLTADTEEHALKVWRRFLVHLETTPLGGLVKDHSREHSLVTFQHGATVQMLSAHNPENLSGDGVTLWLIDEAQYLTRAAWDNLFPSTAERNGVIVMAGVSEGEGPFKEVCYRGDHPDHPEYQRLVFPTASNPYVPPWRVEFARRTLPAHKFRQLYLAEWVGELGKVFRNVEGCTLPARQYPVHVAPGGWGYIAPYQDGHTYYGGLDLARLQDWTVYTIWSADGRLVAWDRFNAIGWEVQKARICALSRAYGHPVTVVDATGVGDPLYDDLAKLGMAVTEYKIASNERKRLLIDELAVRIGAGQVRYPAIPVLLDELQRFEARRVSESSLTVRYEAPAGATDDFVLACALAMQVLPPPTPSARVPGQGWSRPGNREDEADDGWDPRSGSGDGDEATRHRAAYEYIA